MMAVSTSCGTRGRLGSAARPKNKMPSGHRNQPDLPKSVIWSKDQTIQRGRWPTPLMAAASNKNITSQENRHRHAGRDGEPLRINRPWISHVTAHRAQPASRTPRPHWRRSGAAQLARLPASRLIPLAARHGFSAERNTVSITGRPMLML